MKKLFIPMLCYLIIFVILIKIDDISTFLSKTILSNQMLTIPDGNDYTKDYDFLFVKQSKDYIPYSYSNLISIVYSVINNHFEEFTFYCPEEYKECINDMVKFTKDEMLLTHINNYVHPYNSLDNIVPLQTSITETGEINIKATYLYSNEEINEINKYVDDLINELYDEELDSYEQIKLFHDYIINHTKYDVERNDKGESKYKSYIAYGIIKDGYATCNGYADIMAIILSKLGYENYKIATTTNDISYESNGHIWNAVKIDNKYLHLDLTWDDPVASDGKDYLYHTYFLVSNEELKEADSGKVEVEEHKFNSYYYQEFNNEKEVTTPIS